MPSSLRGMRQTSPPWHIAMPSGGGIHSINVTGGSGADAQPGSFGSLPQTSGQTGSTKSDSLMADVDPAFGQEVLDVSQRQWVPHLHHHDQTNHFWRAVEIAEWAAHGPELPRSEAARRIALTPPAKMGSHHGRHFHLM